MKNTDKILHSFSVYEIKRHTYKPYEFRWTRFYENNSDFLHANPVFTVDKFLEGELIIASTINDHDNYSILTTRRIISKEGSVENVGYMTDVIRYRVPINSKLEKFDLVFGTIEFKNESVFNFLLEAGKASIIMVYGIRSMIWSHELTDAQMINLMRLWDKRANVNS